MHDYDPEEPAPDALLICPRCGRELEFYGDGTGEIGATVTLGDCERVVCECGAVYTEGATLAVAPERDYDNLETWE